MTPGIGEYMVPPKVGRPTYNQENKAMLQTYRPEQVFIETLPTGEKICRIRSFKSKDAPSPVHPSVKSKTGWWSGALSSRDSDTEKYYPLFLPHRDQSQSPISIWALECTLVEAL